MLKRQTTDNAKWERIEYIYNRLSSAPATIKELSQELDVSSKTIQRDLHEVLAHHGATREGRLWKIDSSKADDNLSAKERIVLAIMTELSKGVGREFYIKAKSLVEQITSQLDHPIFANLESEILGDEHIKQMESVENAIKNKRVISCEYKKFPFELKPLKLAFFGGFWYLVALDAKSKDAFKKFHLKSLKNIEPLEANFEIPKEFEAKIAKANSIWFKLDAKPMTVRLWIDKEVVPYFERKPLKTQVIEARDKDGSIVIAVEITHEMEILPLIQWYIPHIRILEPSSLADKLYKKLEKYKTI